MKRLLLFSIALATTGSLLAQSTQNSLVPQQAPLNSIINSIDPPKNAIPLSNDNNNVVFHHSYDKTINPRSAAVNFTEIASSVNVNTVLVSQSNCLNANTALNLIGFTHRACVTNVYGVGNSGWIQTTYSTDGGNTWDSSLVVMSIGKTNTDTACRYPSGAIYNPIGNSTPGNAYTLVAGPITNNTIWSGYFFGSSTFGATNNSQQVDLIGSQGVTFEYMPRIGMTYAGNHSFVLALNQVIVTTGTDGVFRGLVLDRGTFNSGTNSFTWLGQELRTPLALNPRDAVSDSTYYQGNSDMAWSAGGDTGYVVQFGVDSAQFASAGVAGFYPVVFKSVDSGVTWTKLPYFDFTTVIPNAILRSTSSIPFIDAVNGSKCVVDYNGNLHIITDLESGSSNPDSLDYSYALPSYIFDLSTSDGTNWIANYIDTIASTSGTSTSWYSTAEFVNARIQASLTPDRKKVFVTWLDSQPWITQIPTNDYPDIYGMGLDYTDNFVTPVVNFTGASSFAESCYWTFAANNAFDNNGTYTIPCTMTTNGNLNGGATNTVQHYYVSGIQFIDSDFTNGIAVVANSKLGVGIYPNPTTGLVNISFTKYTGEASLIVTNILGTTVKQLNNVNVGSNNLTLNLSDLVSGIYFVRIETAQGSETQKIVIAGKN